MARRHSTAEEAQEVARRVTVEEVRRVLAQMDGVPGLMAQLVYGAGLRLMECVRLR